MEGSLHTKYILEVVGSVTHDKMITLKGTRSSLIIVFTFISMHVLSSLLLTFASKHEYIDHYYCIVVLLLIQSLMKWGAKRNRSFADHSLICYDNNVYKIYE